MIIYWSSGPHCNLPRQLSLLPILGNSRSKLRADFPPLQAVRGWTCTSDKWPTGQELSSAEGRGRGPETDPGPMPLCCELWGVQFQRTQIFCSEALQEQWWWSYLCSRGQRRGQVEKCVPGSCPYFRYCEDSVRHLEVHAKCGAGLFLSEKSSVLMTFLYIWMSPNNTKQTP